MNAKLTCAVVTLVGEGDPGALDRCAVSVQAATEYSSGRFGEIVHLRINDPGKTLGPVELRSLGLNQASELGAEWVCFLEVDETLCQDAFELVAPSLQAYDAVWGGICNRDSTAARGKTDFACQDFLRFFHLALHWEIGRTHFAKTAAAIAAASGESVTRSWYADYLLRLWQDAACLKTAQPLSARYDGAFGLSDAEKARLISYLTENPLFISFDHRGRGIKLPYTGCNPTLERVQLRGGFYELEDLEYVGSRVSPGSTIVDVGANTGNHTVYFAVYLEPQRVIPIEPNPEAVSALKSAIRANGIDCVDPLGFEKAAGAAHGRATLKTQRRKQFGSVGLVADDGGGVEVAPLDDLIDGPVDFIKIDVEAMELDVLMGARTIVDRDRPFIFIEVRDDNIPQFLKLIETLGYRIDRVFPDQSYANYFISPLGREGAMEPPRKGL